MEELNIMNRTTNRIDRIKSVLDKRQTTLTVVFENVWDPHNLSACLRSCDAVGILEVHLVYDGSHPFPKLVETSSASAKKWIQSKRYISIEECYKELKIEGKKILTTHLSTDAVSIYDVDFCEPIALVFGNEHSGVSDKAVELADGNILIPQIGMIKSLNISVACAVTVFEAYRQRTVAGMYNNCSLPDSLYEATYNEWLKK